MSDEVEEKEEDYTREVLTADEALKLTDGLEAQSIVDIAVEKALNEVCKYVKTAAKAGYYQVVLEMAGLKQLPNYVEPRAKMLDIENQILTDLECALLDLGYYCLEDGEDYVVSWVTIDD